MYYRKDQDKLTVGRESPPSMRFASPSVERWEIEVPIITER